MTRILPLFALLLLPACEASTRPNEHGGPVQGPTVSLGGSVSSFYGNVRQ